MANDRLFLHCPRCGKQFQLAKRMADHWYTGNNWDGLAPLNDFFEKHLFCGEDHRVDAYAFELHNEHGAMAVVPICFKSPP